MAAEGTDQFEGEYTLLQACEKGRLPIKLPENKLIVARIRKEADDRYRLSIKVGNSFSCVLFLPEPPTGRLARIRVQGPPACTRMGVSKELGQVEQLLSTAVSALYVMEVKAPENSPDGPCSLHLEGPSYKLVLGPAEHTT